MRIAMRYPACAVTAFATLFGGYGMQSPPAAQAASCTDIDLAFARGTNEPAGLGDVGSPSPTRSRNSSRAPRG
ncbi:Hypothetical protein MAB_4404 [Mycobacteroides abscessus ATCC 19977]|uniref:Uncharacterized protein n=1 Tax=Mycobacteroides abscessus (strain ATCC 19977 / DSM 44196 / CCUG 20993 / CIP 104536 / JCM 13569 / NCTC 13031 / TMC 1543 / L948) TaxID=561007 RepID=B1MJW7_MYCA9|nr:Hypothetical protein MAB_4404 [Mycobacteroides abscessus ATCC 19977]